MKPPAWMIVKALARVPVQMVALVGVQTLCALIAHRHAVVVQQEQHVQLVPMTVLHPVVEVPLLPRVLHAPMIVLHHVIAHVTILVLQHVKVLRKERLQQVQSMGMNMLTLVLVYFGQNVMWERKNKTIMETTTLLQILLDKLKIMGTLPKTTIRHLIFKMVNLFLVPI